MRITGRNANGEGTTRLRKDGRYEGMVFVNTSDGRRKRVTVYARTREACHDEVVKLQDQVRRRLPVATMLKTVGDFLAYWLEHMARPAIRRTTFVTYGGAIRSTSCLVWAATSSKRSSPGTSAPGCRR
jgi:hypothetical protein